MQILRKREEMVYPTARSHPRLHRLSETDQLSIPISKLYFYRQGPPSSDVHSLKTSLCKALALFYPMAGRLVDRSLDTASTCSALIGDAAAESAATCHTVTGHNEERADTRNVAIRGRKDVSCLDQGALFCEAWADARLDAYLPDFQPHPDLLALLPLDPQHNDVLLKVQVTHFACGGMCLCVVTRHNLFDGTSSAHFMECWVELASGKENVTVPPHICHIPLEIMYMPKEPSNSYLEFCSVQNQLPSYTEGGHKNRIFHFTPTFIDALKREASDGGDCKYSSFECIAAFLWRNVTLARGIGSNEEVSLLYSVNGRGKLNPSLPPSYFGNVVFQTYAVTRASDLLEKELSLTTNLIRKASSRICDEYMRNMLKWSMEQSSPMPSQRSIASPSLLINTWTSFPFYDFNFGWGKPVCCRPHPCIQLDYVGLLPSYFGKGHIEALVALDEKHMQKLESLIPVGMRG